MSEASESPIIGRLKQFMAYCNMSNSQFADYTGIPRPTLSQLLHGRNKSVNDQLIRKLHESFPALNVVWLLFGKGEMLTDANIEFSDAQNEQKIANFDSQSDVNQHSTLSHQSNSPSLFSVVNQIDNLKNSGKSSSAPSDDTENLDNRQKSQKISRNDSGADAAIAASLQSNQEKKISSIIVLYSDNSFETFLPA